MSNIGWGTPICIRCIPICKKCIWVNGVDLCLIYIYICRRHNVDLWPISFLTKLWQRRRSCFCILYFGIYTTKWMIFDRNSKTDFRWKLPFGSLQKAKPAHTLTKIKPVKQGDVLFLVSLKVFTKLKISCVHMCDYTWILSVNAMKREIFWCQKES